MVDFSDNTQAAMRAAQRFDALGGKRDSDQLSFVMDLTAADGVNGNPAIDWTKLETFPDFDFLHDCYGIQRHLDRETGKLTGHFLPRCSR